MNLADLKTAFEKGDLRALSRFISAAENQDVALWPVMKELFKKSGKARVIGITGPPGAGKSTLTGHFVKWLRDRKKTVAVIAVDPVSPFTGGALLGDRIRLVDHFNDPGVFIRSLSTRGKLGGLSLATRQVIHLADSFGIDYVIVETVGVGQSEVDVRKTADATVVVLVPEWGDAVQTLKAGLLEIGDLFVVNKADREGADRLATELKNMLQIAQRESTPVLQTSTQDAKSLNALFEATDGFFDDKQERIAERRKQGVVETMRELMESFVVREVQDWVARQGKSAANPYEFIVDFVKKHPAGSLFSK